MYNIRIFLKLVLNTFSFRRGSIRYISLKRIGSVLLIYPFFTLVFIVNRLFLLLDELVFPGYRKQSAAKSVFIIGVPRSATTYLFNALYRDQESFHCFKLWELVFAPSVIQKYIFLAIIAVDRKLGSLLYKASLRFDDLVFSTFREIHDIGLTKPEEDEVLFIYNFSSLYFYYFFPELAVLDNMLYHDQLVPERVKKRNISFYFRCVQRHNFVFDRQSEKYFLSKNPTFIPKMESIANKFEHAKFIYPIRSPHETIPSTISLNARIFSNFARLPVKYPFPDETREMLIRWYKHAESIIRDSIPDRTIKVYYKELIENPVLVFSAIYEFLLIDSKSKIEVFDYIRFNQKNYRSKHKYDSYTGIDAKELIRELADFLQADEIARL